MERGDQSEDIFHGAAFERMRNGITLNERSTTEIHNINSSTNPDFNITIPCRQDLDLLLPAATINRIMRQVLPSYANISQDSKKVVQQCASEFISFITSEANERGHSEHRRKITAEDILGALSRFGFDNHVYILSRFLNRYRLSEGSQVPRGKHHVNPMQPPSQALQTVPSVASEAYKNYDGQISEEALNQDIFQYGSGSTHGGPNVDSSFHYSFSPGCPPF